MTVMLIGVDDERSGVLEGVRLLTGLFPVSVPRLVRWVAAVVINFF